MCGRAYDPRFLFAWPSAKSAVMGPQQLAGCSRSSPAPRPPPRASRTTRRPTRACAPWSSSRSRPSRCRCSSPGGSTTTASSTPRHPHRPRPVPVRDPHRALRGRARWLRRLPDVRSQ
ncbi:hypothetical protein NKH77_23595 [Streptomyces sp. M19]